ncbi:proteasome activator complex subunit 3-like [Amphibalanus amphitrite]|uniref:proteasome activator complex subunit 3-like n=1 Tax=Amphibalanus amphitrite TaxID=1232801 RepID=UPI001C91DB05|nr:proteasome activator complex subunit 3-like [Amphibalanus amphitrite]
MVSASEAKEARAKVEQFKKSVTDEGERLVKEVFPQRILELNDLLAKPPFTATDLTQFHSALNIPVPEPRDTAEQPAKRRKLSGDNGVAAAVDGTKVMALPSGPVPCNKLISEIIETLKPIIRQIMEETNLLKMWVTYMIPKIEDGNNFGVSIQEDTLGEVSSAESEAATFFQEMSRYYSFRAKLISKVAKYPHLDDYRRSVQEMDEKEFISLRLTLVEIRNRYSTLHDVISKNLEKIKKPRSVNSHDTMY